VHYQVVRKARQLLPGKVLASAQAHLPVVSAHHVSTRPSFEFLNQLHCQSHRFATAPPHDPAAPTNRRTGHLAGRGPSRNTRLTLAVDLRHRQELASGASSHLLTRRSGETRIAPPCPGSLAWRPSLAPLSSRRYRLPNGTHSATTMCPIRSAVGSYSNRESVQVSSEDQEQ
jgi:hypothetical protein